MMHDPLNVPQTARRAERVLKLPRHLPTGGATRQETALGSCSAGAAREW